MSKLKAAKKALDNLLSTDEGLAILNKIDTPEKAIKLKGKEREEYLKALDAVYGPQSKRAKDLGFGEKTYYHGTGRSFDAFDSSRLGEMTGGPTRKLGHHFTNNPEVANQYAVHGQIYGKGQGQVLPVRIKTKGAQAFTSDNAMPGYEDAENVLSSYKKTDFKPVILRDMNDALYVGDNTIGDIAIVPQANQIRSKFAAFDPRFKNSDYIMAAQGDANKTMTGLFSNLASKALKKLDEPKEYVQGKIKEGLGIQGGNIENAPVDIVQNLSERTGLLNDDSATSNALKALATVPVELATDPTSYIPGPQFLKRFKGLIP